MTYFLFKYEFRNEKHEQQVIASSKEKALEVLKNYFKEEFRFVNFDKEVKIEKIQKFNSHTDEYYDNKYNQKLKRIEAHKKYQELKKKKNLKNQEYKLKHQKEEK